MLKLKGIKKVYQSGGLKVNALRGIDIEFRNSEFVSVLGPSGCGKTTFLNIIGGLDHYTEGDLIIKGKSTKDFTDREWDAYRNHSVGFVFQNYNLIPHQTVLANVELALTLSGVNKKERRRRAEDALRRIGLEDQMLKKPNQMSGGQMQRVAIARAIVNDPEILLADEPTGALDSETSIQVMEILKEIAADRLVVMVTHNPELAEKYSSRIIKLKDGKITDDSSPYSSSEKENVYKLKKNKSMSFFTALGLSLRNLLTKKGRTLMTCFAGSIGIIGIALILSVSHGVNIFINKVQEDTLSKYPLTINAEQVDMAGMLESMMDKDEDGLPKHDNDKVYSSNMMFQMVDMMTSVPKSKNNIVDFKKYIDNNEEFHKYASAVKYSYDIPMNSYVRNNDGKISRADSETVLTDMYREMGLTVGDGSASSSMVDYYASYIKIWEEMLPGENSDELVNTTLKDQYDLVYGEWPRTSNEVVLVLNEKNEIGDFVLYALGLKSSAELSQLIEAAKQGNELEIGEQSWTYEEICGLTIRMILAPDCFQKQSNGTYIDISKTETGLSYLFSNDDKYKEIKISGIIKPNENALFSMISGSLGYTSALKEEIIKETLESEIVKEQLASPEIDVFTGLPFKDSVKEPERSEKISLVKEYFSNCTEAEKAVLYVAIHSEPSKEYVAEAVSKYMENMNRNKMIDVLVNAYAEKMHTTDVKSIRAYFEKMNDENITKVFQEHIEAYIRKQYADGIREQIFKMTPNQIAALFDAEKFSDDEYVLFYSLYLPKSVSEAKYDENISKLGYADIDKPSMITIYADTFNDKNKINDLIDDYNSQVDEDNRIKTTDYIKLLMSSISTVINAISYVLIAFLGISLIVSSIMIGVITNISVLERTKEIGILRAVGASKSDVAHVFNAETFIIGLLSGLIGIGITLICIIPVNILLNYFTGIAYLNASLPLAGAIVLVVLNMLFTIIAGLIPSRSASKKDPVVALRSE